MNPPSTSMSSSSGPGSAHSAELTYFRGVDDLVLAAGVADERFDPEVLDTAIRAALAA
jgi:hypothetical protein